MNQPAPAMTDQQCSEAKSKFSDLSKESLWGVCLNPSQQVIATHQELAVLRRCATLVNNNPNQIVHVLSPLTNRHTNFIVKTLMHFGVSCGNIQVSNTTTDSSNPKGICIFVKNRQAD